MSGEWKSPSEEEEDAEWTQIVRNACGLPIELCDCPDDPPAAGPVERDSAEPEPDPKP